MNASSASVAGSAATSSPDKVNDSIQGEAAKVASSTPAVTASMVPQIRIARSIVTTTTRAATIDARTRRETVEPPPTSRRPR